MTRKHWWILAITLLVLGAAGYWVYDNIEWQEVRVPGLPKGEAVNNDLYAAQLLLAEYGAQARSSTGFDELPAEPKRAVVILPTQRRTVSSRQRTQLLDWVAAGGHLVVVTYTLEDEGDAPDPLMTQLGVQQKMHRAKKPAKDAAGASDRPRQPVTPPRSVRRTTRNAGNFAACPEQTESGAAAPRFPATPLAVCFDKSFYLESAAPALWNVQSLAGSHALTMALGQGRVTVLTDYDFMRNDAIGEADHADFLVALLGPNLKGLTIWLIPHDEVDPLSTLVWRYGWTVVLAFTLLVAIVLWRDGMRFGPLVPKAEAVRRSLLEHVRASGEFLWRRRQGRVLWQSTLAATQRRIALTIPHTTDPERLYQLLAARTGVDVPALRHAFFPTIQPRGEEFARAIATLEQVRKHL